MNITKRDEELVKEWKDLAAKYNLELYELKELVYHILQIRRIIEKK